MFCRQSDDAYHFDRKRILGECWVADHTAGEFTGRE